jgi:hypothetical protein
MAKFNCLTFIVRFATLFDCESQFEFEPAAKRAALPRGGRVLIRSRDLSTHCRHGGGFFVLTRPPDGDN